MITSHKYFAQVIAGSPYAGLIVSNPNVNISVAQTMTTDSAYFDLDCDSVADFHVKIHKSITAIDGANTAYLYIDNSTFRFCADSVNSYFPQLKFYSAGDTLNCAGANNWLNDTIMKLGDYGCMMCMGPASASNVYLAYENTSNMQQGWVKISFDLYDGGSQTLPVTLSVPEILSPCTNTYLPILPNNSTSGTDTCPPFIIAYTITPPTCGGLCDGEINLSVSGGTPSYSFVWSNGQTGNNISGVCSGVLQVSVTDANGATCTSTLAVPQGPQMTIVTTATDVTCYGNSDGAVCANASGGTGPYTYYYMPSGVTTNCNNNLFAGNYAVCVQDAAGCQLCQSFTITQPPAITVSVTVTDASCTSCCDGDIQVLPDGGSPPYSITFTPGATIPPNSFCYGQYFYCVQDSAGCTFCDSAFVNTPSSLSEALTTPDFKIVPNPVQDKFSVLMDDGTVNCSLRIIDAAGRAIVIVKKYLPGSVMDLSLEAGIYIVEILDSRTGMAAKKRLIIQ